MTDPSGLPRPKQSGISGLVLVGLLLTVPSVLAPSPVTAQIGSNQTLAVPTPPPAGGPSEAEVLFRFPTGGVVTTGPAVGGSMVWFISDSRILYILDSAGKAIGRRTMSYRRAAFIACDPFGRAVIPEEPSRLTMVNRAGQTVWSLDLGLPSSSSAALGPPAFGPDGRLYVSAGGFLSAFAPNGRRLWQVELSSGTQNTVRTGPGGGPVLRLDDGSISLWSQDGEELWLYSPGSESGSGVASSGPRRLLLAADDGAVACTHSDGRIVRLNAQGQLLWSYKAPFMPVALALGAEDSCLIASEDGRLAKLGAAGLVWQTQARSGFVSAGAGITVYENRIILSWKGGAASFGTDGGKYRELTIRNPATIPALAPGGTVFSGGVDWIMYAYRFERGLTLGKALVLPGLERMAVRQAAREEAFWTPGGMTDDVVLARLADIEKSLKSGTIGEGAEPALLFAAAVALGDFEAPFGSGAVSPGPVPRGPLPRAMACQTLGLLGSPRSLPVLTEVFQRDPEPVVRAAAAQAVAAIGLDPGGFAQEAFARAASEGLDPRTAGSVIEAIEGLYRSNGALDNLAGALALARLAVGNYPRDLRARAETALRKVSAPR